MKNLQKNIEIEVLDWVISIRCFLLDYLWNIMKQLIFIFLMILVFFTRDIRFCYFLYTVDCYSVDGDFVVWCYGKCSWWTYYVVTEEDLEALLYQNCRLDYVSWNRNYYLVCHCCYCCWCRPKLEQRLFDKLVVDSVDVVDYFGAPK